MKKIFPLIISLLLVFTVYSQDNVKRVFVEDFHSAYCCFCPDGGYYLDSLLNKHPELINVTCHSGWGQDAMWFEEIDTLSYGMQVYGVPTAAIDRIHYPTDSVLGTWNGVIQGRNIWDTLIQQRLLIQPKLNVIIDSVSWDSLSRDIFVTAKIDILDSLPPGDYRIGLYIVEDSIMGIQYNAYNTTIGHPFYGLGDPINNYYHRRVARALLPSAWGFQGFLPSLLNSGQSYSQSFNYNLPIGYNEDQVSLVAFAYRYSSNHDNDEVLNADQVPLYDKIITSLNKVKKEKTNIVLYPNPTSDIFTIEGENISSYFVMNSVGQIIENKTTNNNTNIFDLSNEPNGIYLVNIVIDNNIIFRKIIKQ